MTAGATPKPRPAASPDVLCWPRADLHCHSDASNKAAEAALNAINCPECYSSPAEVYAQAKRRGMDFVTITDHDSIEGVLRIVDHQPGVFVGEELTCWFPEDECKMHVLVYGISRADHEALQSLAENIYDVAAYIARERIAHAVATRSTARTRSWSAGTWSGYCCCSRVSSATTTPTVPCTARRSNRCSTG